MQGAHGSQRTSLSVKAFDLHPVENSVLSSLLCVSGFLAWEHLGVFCLCLSSPHRGAGAADSYTILAWVLRI